MYPGKIETAFTSENRTRTTPSIVSPMMTITTPDSRAIMGTLRSSTDPTSANDTPNAVNTSVNPATNSIADVTRRRRDSRWSRSAIGIAEM